MLIPYILYLHRTVLLSTMQKNYSQNIVVGKRLCWKLLNNAGAHSCVVGEPLSNVLDIESESLKLVAYENEAGYTIKDALKAINSDSTNRDILICIGPEGGFQEKEINDIIECGGQSVALGHTILRAETAAIAAL